MTNMQSTNGTYDPKPDVPDNFKKFKTKTIPKIIILSKSKYDSNTRH